MIYSELICKICKTEKPMSHRTTKKKLQQQQHQRLRYVSTPSIRRFCRRAGSKRIQASQVIPTVRRLVIDFTDKIVRKATCYTEHAKRKTVTTADILAALRATGRSLYGYDDDSQFRRHNRFTSSQQQMTHNKKKGEQNINTSNFTSSNQNTRRIFCFVRHGERIDDPAEDKNDNDNNSAKKKQEVLPVVDRPDGENDGEDPSLTERGYRKARDETAKQLIDGLMNVARKHFSSSSSSLLSNPIIHIKFVVSPFLRCLQTTKAILEGMQNYNNIKIDRDIQVDNRFSEINNKFVIKNCRDQVNGPQLMSNRNLISFNDDDDDDDAMNNNNNDNNYYNLIEDDKYQIPEFHTETREEAYYIRFRRAFRDMLLEADEGKSDNNKYINDAERDSSSMIEVTMIVTHGDVLNACMVEMAGTSRVVYSIDYLANYLVVQNEKTADDDETLPSSAATTMSNISTSNLLGGVMPIYSRKDMKCKWDIEETNGLGYFDS